MTVYPATGDSAIVLAHGAGAGQRHPFMVRVATGLAARGIACVTFDFRYLAEKRGRPDPGAVLEAEWREAIAAARAQFAGRRLFLGGKSMGGRIATQVAASGVDGVGGIVLLGYPLHPPDKPEQLRVRHLPRVTVPTLFVQGSRDEFGTPDELRPHLASMARATLYVVEGGDHSLAVRKRDGVPQETVYERALDEIARWIMAACIAAH